MVILFQLLFLFLHPLPLAKEVQRPVARVHPLYVSVTEVTQNTAEKSLEVSCRFFADDFEETLKAAYKTKLDISSAQEKSTFDKLIPDYINKHLALSADGKSVHLSYIGYEKEKETVYCYFEVQQVTAVKQIAVSNTLLHDFKNEQINIMHVTVNGKRQSSKLDYPAATASFRF